MKRTHLNLVLLLAVAGLGAAAWFGQEKEEKGAPLTPLTAEGLTRIALEHPGQPRILLEKQGEHWRLVEPVQAETDPYEVSAITSLATLETRRSLEPSEVQLSELGLEPPRYRVVLNDVAIEVGDQQPLEGHRYLRTGGKVVLVDDPPSAPLDAEYADLVAKTLLPQGAELAKIELPGFTVAKADDGKSWAATPPQADTAADAGARLAQAWQDARAMWLAMEPAGGSTGEAVTLHLKGGETVRLVVVEREPQLVLARPDLKVRYTLSKALESELFRLAPAPKPAESAPPAPPAQTKS